MNIEANDPGLRSWIEYPEDSDFPIQNLPFGIKKSGTTYHAVSIIGDQVIDLYALSKLGVLNVEGLNDDVLSSPHLNDFIALGKKVTNGVRNKLSLLFRTGDTSNLTSRSHEILTPVTDCELTLPIKIGDYTDFYSSREHATNVGTMFRDPKNALLPNWLHLPVGYHGRASSIVVSGTEIKRPSGQMIPAGADSPVYGPCKLLDFELEMAFVVGKPNALGTQVTVDDAEDHIFGLALFNDWSARDIQKWEYVPLGPFLGKNFASTMSPWIVTIEALDPFRIQSPERDPEVLPYLRQEGKFNFNIELEVDIQTPAFRQTVSKSNMKHLYWSMSQQLAHHTVNGCNMQVGDVCASGTISGTSPEAYGSMLELSWRGTKPLQMPDGSDRKFLVDGDTVVLRGWGQGDGYRIGFGEASGLIVP